MKIYLVGGAVRDELLGLDVAERDWVVVGAMPADMLQLGYNNVGKSFPVFLHPETKEEYALARTERKSGRGYTGFEVDAAPHVTLEEDLMRRDLTINAIAKDEHGKIIDPYHGQRDLKDKILRHVSPAFVEDPVRVLRVARFAARFEPLGFKIAPETLTLMQTMVDQGECAHLVAERVWKEMSRALALDSPVAFIQTLRACGALKVILPELDALYGVDQDPKYHPEVDCGKHMELVLAQATQLTADPEIRFAALMHDVGKALTPQDQLPRHPDHEVKGAILVKALCERLAVPNDFKALAMMVTKFHGLCHKALNLSAEEILNLLEQCDAFRRRDRFEQFLIACQADSQGRTGFENLAYPQVDLLRQCLDAALSVDIQAIVSQKLNGEAIKQALYQARLEAINRHHRQSLK